MTTIIDNKPMKWAMEAAAKVRGWDKGDPAALAIQQAAEPILAVVRACITDSHDTDPPGVTHWHYCKFCDSGGPPDKPFHNTNCPVPAALKAMETTE